MSEPELAVEAWPIEQVTPYADNAKKHSDEQIKQVAHSISHFGWDQPIVVDRDGVIVKGHGRFLAAQQLDLKKVPVIHRKDLHGQSAQAARLADNKVVSQDYDSEAVKTQLAELESDLQETLRATGFETELDKIVDEDTFAALDESAFADDLTEELGEQERETEKKVAETDDKPEPVSKALGFAKLPISQHRRVKAFIADLEKETGEEGAEAFMTFIERAGY